MFRQSLKAGGSSFAHLMPGAAARAAAAKAAEDDDDKKKAEEDDDKKKAETDDDDDKKKAKKAEGDDDDDDGDDDDKKKKAYDDDDDAKAKKAKAKNEDDDDEENEKAARAERAYAARGDAIFGCSAAGLRPDVAAFVAFRTNLSAPKAIALLKVVVANEGAAAPTVSRTDLRSRMASEPHYDVGPEAQRAAAATAVDEFAAKMKLADEKRRGIA